MAPAAPERLVVGLVRGLHGLRGAVRIEVLSDEPDRFDVGSVVFTEGAGVPLTVTWVQSDGPGLLVLFAERPTRESAEDLRDRYLEANVLAPLPQGAWYWHELEGVPVTTTTGETLGRVADVFRAGGGEILVVTGGPRGEILVPAVAAVIQELAPADGRIVVDPEALALDDTEARPRLRGRRTTRAFRASEQAAAARETDAPAPDEGAP